MSRRRPWLEALAASLVLAATGGGVAYDQLAGRISTERGEVREIALADGSKIVLNSDTTIQVRYGDEERSIVLRKGEASFNVAHDESRPFVVRADDLAVRAVGTEFVVGMKDDDVAVTVSEGVVELGGRKTVPGSRFLRRDEQYVAAPTGSRKAVLDSGEVQRRLAWRKGLLVFRGQSLAAAAADVNKYAEMPVIIDDPTLAKAEFIGVFHVGDSQAFAKAAAFAFNGAVVQRDNGLHLMRRQNSPSH